MFDEARPGHDKSRRVLRHLVARDHDLLLVVVQLIEWVEDLFLRSGHLPYYAESMYAPMELEGVKYYVKPMNCPMHHKIFGAKGRSYRDLPIRLAEYGTCYRYEKSGELFGLMRVRSMQMNDAHIYCSEDQFEQEFMGVVELYKRYFELFGIEKYVMRLSLHSKEGLGKKYVNNPELWIKTEDMVRRAMDNGGVPYVEREDEAAFYGPKIDVQIWSAIGREFSLATNQVDFAVPERFDLKFTNHEGHDEIPLCIHRAPLGTHERFIGFLIEHYAGNFPVWLSPEQVPRSTAEFEKLKLRGAYEKFEGKVPIFDTVAVDMQAGKATAPGDRHLFRANGSMMSLRAILNRNFGRCRNWRRGRRRSDR